MTTLPLEAELPPRRGSIGLVLPIPDSCTAAKKGGNGVVSRTERFRRVIRCGAQQDIARWIISKRRRRWLHRLRAECPGGVPLWAANFRYGELPCILPVTDFLRNGPRRENTEKAPSASTSV